jgi:hypothetical protein
MSSRFDIARYHKPLSVCCFGGISLALLVATGMSWNGGSTGLAVGFGAAFVVVGGLAGLYFLDLFIWGPRREEARTYDRVRQFRQIEETREERSRQRRQGQRG